MHMKKSALALAVTGAITAPSMASAAEVYGRVNLALANSNEDAALNQGFFQGPDNYGNDEGLGLMSVTSRFGFQGSEDLGGGLEGIYRYEFEVDATDAGLGETDMGDNTTDIDGATRNNDRISYIGLSGDFGQVKVGKMWTAMYEVIGWTVVRSQEYSYTPYFYAPTGNFLGQYREEDLIQYRYGGGGYSSDPFTFYVEAQADGASGGGDNGASANVGATSDNAEAFDYLQLGAQGNVGPVTLGAVYRQQQAAASDAAEPTFIAGSVRWSSGPLYVGGVVGQTDPDQDVAQDDGSMDTSKPLFAQFLGTYDFGGGLSAQLGYGFGDADGADTPDGGYANDGDANDLDSAVYVQVNQSLSSRTAVYLEGEFDSFNEDFDADNGSGGSPSVAMVGLRHDF